MSSLLADGRTITQTRKDPTSLNKHDFPEYADLDDDKAGPKILQIQKGMELKGEDTVMPYNRECKDVFWLVFFVIAVLATIFSGIFCSGPLLHLFDNPSNSTEAVDCTHGKCDTEDSPEMPGIHVWLASIFAGGVAAIVVSAIFILLAAKAPSCVVWTSLVAIPVIFIIAGAGMVVAFMGTWQMWSGVVLAGCGVLSLVCVFCCYKNLVPFMIKLVEAVADVIKLHPCMFFIGLIGAILGILWTTLAGFSTASLYVYIYSTGVDMSNNTALKGTFVFLTTLMFVWGSQVVNNVVHVTYCGVYARWYYGVCEGTSSSGSDYNENAPTLGPSFKVATTTSLGSICFGSFLVALIRGLEALANSAKKDAAESGNSVGAIFACLLECLIRCIGDILDYFNEWAYIQCAVRGVGFYQAVEITFSMMTCANMKYLLADLLLNNVVSMGSLLVGLAATLTAGAVGWGLGGTNGMTLGAILGLLIGVIAGSSAMGIINSGVKTILACYADDPTPFEASHPELAKDFNERIGHGLGMAWGKNKDKK